MEKEWFEDENRRTREAPPSQDNGDMALELLNGDLSYRSLAAALRQRADEATRAENEACALLIHDGRKPACGYYTGEEATLVAKAAAIRARIKP